jgi:hypothetical protein
MPGTGVQYGLGVVVDVNGNIYTVGDNLGVTDFDPGPGTYNLSTSGYNDIFMSKLTYQNVTSFKSAGAPDGWVLETSETSNQGGAINAAAVSFLLGDHASKRQYRSILHFNTSSLPDNAVITRVSLKIKKQSVFGTNPFTTHLKIAVDIRQGAFGTSGALQVTDFQAAAHKPGVGFFANNPQAGAWYVTPLKAVAYPYINRAGITQFRLHFQTDDDNDFLADYIRFYSGDAAAANRPVLVIEYYVP